MGVTLDTDRENFEAALNRFADASDGMTQIAPRLRADERETMMRRISTMRTAISVALSSVTVISQYFAGSNPTGYAKRATSAALKTATIALDTVTHECERYIQAAKQSDGEISLGKFVSAYAALDALLEFVDR